jgi:predicted transcriptional regulator/transcriptional regulator with XRE-family HTH domain
MQHKTFIGPRLRRLRLERGETQAQMAKGLGISAAYVNLLENNQRSVSVQVLLRLLDAYGVDWRDIAEDEGSTLLADLRAIVQDPVFEGTRPDLAQLRAALVHCPTLAAAFLRLHQSYQSATETMLAISEGASEPTEVAAASAPEAAVHNFFRKHRNHFRELEEAAAGFWSGEPPEVDDLYQALKLRLRDELGITVRVVPVEALPNALRSYDERRRDIVLSQALDHPNRTFQLVHVMGLITIKPVFDALVERAAGTEQRAQARLRVELANYFAAAVLMPYDAFLAEARASKYDFDHLAIRFGVSFEQACHRATTMQREGAQGVPFFFLRIDKAGNVTKRFNATSFHLAEFGGACPRLEVHTSFRTPGRIVPQFVEMPDQSQFFVFSRTVERPIFERFAQDNRLAVAMGCSIDQVGEIGYAEAFAVSGTRMTPIGINCRICPRPNCDQRAYQAAMVSKPVDERRRGATRFES